MDELGFVDWIVRRSGRMHRGVKVGPGDDCAVIEGTGSDDIVFTIDEVVEGTHFRLSGKGLGPKARGRDVGYKALAASASDLAAMGAEPVGAVAAAALRKGQAARLGKAIHTGLADAARDSGCPLVGGNVTGTKGPVTLTVACVGRVPKGRAFVRSGARPGDVLFVTGELGGSILGRHLRPVPRFAEARRARKLGGVRAMMDITDGLALDLSRLAEASGVGAEIEADAVPVSKAAKRLARRSEERTGKGALAHALSDGEDYELLIAVDPRRADAFERGWGPPTPLARVGVCLPRGRGLLLRSDGRARRLAPEGFRHL
ncbi:MAG: thiamine-phosphate kinase [Planctomycetota bacterium]|jgi:thiamine-monophosphate kinase